MNMIMTKEKSDSEIKIIKSENDKGKESDMENSETRNGMIIYTVAVKLQEKVKIIVQINF